jgi:PAS domain S-box-containing protein
MNQSPANYQFLIYSWLLLVSALVGAVVGVIIWRRRAARPALYLAGFEFAAVSWAIAAVFEMAATTIPLKFFWSKVGYFGTTTTPMFFFLFAAAYARQHRFLTRRVITSLLIIPVISIIMAFTNEWHHWLWTGMTIDPITNIAMYGHDGFWFWILVAYAYIMLTGGVLILGLAMYRFPTFYAPQLGMLIIGAILPFVGNVMYVFNLNPIPGMDWTPIMFIASGMFLAFAIFQLRLFDLLPVARSTLVDTMPDGMLALDSQNRIVDINPAMQAVTGLLSKAAIGQSAVSALAGWDDLQRYLHVNQEIQAEVCFRQDTRECCYDLNLTFIKNRYGEITGKLLVLRDITSHKQTKTALEIANRKLQKEISEREQLIADLNAVAHDLKSPLSVIVSSSQMLTDGTIGLNEEAAPTVVELIHRTSLKTIKIVNELLTLASVRQQDIQPEPLNMAAIITEVETRLCQMVDAYGVQIIKPATWPQAVGHASWVEEVWANYISNGIKYGGQPPILKLNAKQQDNGMICFWVQDNGDGLPADALSQLFKEYTRLTATGIEGQGLGLSIVKRIVEKLGGQVTVESENVPGQGCIFCFTLPMDNSKRRD